MSDEQKQPDDRAACDREAVLNEVLEALLAAEHHEAYEVVYRMWSAASATAPQAMVQVPPGLSREEKRELILGVAQAPVKGDERVCTCKGVLGHGRQCAMFDESMMRAAVPQAGATLTDEQITAVWNSMPGGYDGFLKSWGYIQFARALLSFHPTEQAGK